MENRENQASKVKVVHEGREAQGDQRESQEMPVVKACLVLLESLAHLARQDHQVHRERLSIYLSPYHKEMELPECQA